ncbi:hypothetical protein CVT24_004138 [Panaeolus cyanescens]|uniref:Carbohydrate-binding module family 19 domain-containing protein n=1 Tax=Panaeolus cyanescens TaxID=181874 RepID=A0A409Y653_9AGAR|nr:hypothetical protein CVT24_004138 [Panaeolus cyanescens]
MPSFKSLSALFLLASLAVSAPTISVRHNGHDDPTTSSASGGTLLQQNGILAQQTNEKYAKIKLTDACTAEFPQACINGGFAQCVNGKWIMLPCAEGTRCYSLPLINKAGESTTCARPDDALSRFKDAGVTGGPAGNDSGNGTDQTPSPSNGSDDDDCDDGDDGDDTDANAGNDDDCDDDDDSGANSQTPTPRTVTRATPPSSSTVQPTDTAGSDSGYGGIYRRQLQLPSSSIIGLPTSTAITTPSGTDVVVLPASSTVIPISQASTPTAVSITQAPVITPSATTTSNGISTPTVVIGQDGIVTVTLVSTVTVTQTDCAALPSASSTVTGLPSISTGASVSSSVAIPSVTISSVPSSSVLSSAAIPSSTLTLVNTTPTVVPSGFDNFSDLLTANTTPTAGI